MLCAKGRFFFAVQAGRGTEQEKTLRALCGFQHHKGENLFGVLFSDPIIVASGHRWTKTVSETDANGKTMLQSFVSKVSKKKAVEDTLVPPLSKKRGGECFFIIFVHAAARGATCVFTLNFVNTLIKTTHATIDLRSRHRINPRPTRFMSGKANECR